MNDQSLTLQQRLVLDGQRLVQSESYEAGRHLDNKATAILQAGGIVIGIITALSLSPLDYRPTTMVQLCLLIVIFSAFAAMLFCALLVLYPSRMATPGNLDWDEQFEGYIYEDIEAAYNQILIDTLETTQQVIKRNERKAKWLKVAIPLFGLQILAILGLAISTAL